VNDTDDETFGMEETEGAKLEEGRGRGEEEGEELHWYLNKFLKSIL